MRGVLSIFSLVWAHMELTILLKSWASQHSFNMITFNLSWQIQVYPDDIKKIVWPGTEFVSCVNLAGWNAKGIVLRLENKLWRRIFQSWTAIHKRQCWVIGYYEPWKIEPASCLYPSSRGSGREREGVKRNIPGLQYGPIWSSPYFWKHELPHSFTMNDFSLSCKFNFIQMKRKKYSMTW
jgi:hypothetical protein